MATKKTKAKTRDIRDELVPRLFSIRAGMPIERFTPPAYVGPDVLVVDAPWKPSDKLPGPGRGASKHYQTLTVEDIARFPLPPTVHDSVLFFWRLASMVDEALHVVRCWGYQPKSELIWEKLTKHGKRHMGMGRYVRNEHEVCIIAVRGKAKPLVHDQRSIFAAPIGQHSEKPDAFYEIVERMYPQSRRFELFSRRHRAGWIQYGNELGKLNQ